MLPVPCATTISTSKRFQWAPTLGGECYWIDSANKETSVFIVFQWAPTLGGECYIEYPSMSVIEAIEFQWAPTLGGECYRVYRAIRNLGDIYRFNGHPPLGVNATV